MSEKDSGLKTVVERSIDTGLFGAYLFGTAGVILAGPVRAFAGGVRAKLNGDSFKSGWMAFVEQQNHFGEGTAIEW